MSKGDTQPRFCVEPYDNEVERLCGYLKNDSVVRWATGATQQQVEDARAKLASKRRRGSYTPKLRSSDDTGQDDMPHRRAMATEGNRRYLEAVGRAHG